MLATANESAILDRVIRPDEVDMKRDAAKAILELGFSEVDHERMAVLSAKAQQGALSEAEQAELDSYINVSHFLALLQSKARLALRNSPPEAA